MKKTFLQLSIFLLFSFLFVGEASALTPIARVDVVPYQTIGHGDTFKFGVVAFHKEGINRVDFEISGQGYSGDPKTSEEMTYNDRTNVWEYWVPISASEFSSNGAINITAVAVGNDGDKRTLPVTTLYVEGLSAEDHQEAWVDIANSDGTGTINDENDPYPDIPSAILAAQEANGGISDGNVIYLEEGTYPFGHASVVTNNKWLTITKSAEANEGNVIINENGSVTNTSKLRLYNITLRADKQGAFNGADGGAWLDDCEVTSSLGRYVGDSTPVKFGISYLTDGTHVYNVDRTTRGGNRMVRGVTIETIGEDAFQNAGFVVNVRLDDQDPGSTYWHADAFQTWGDGPENTIVYNYYGTNLHYQGMFMRATNSAGRNNAFVNVFLEMREPGRPGYDGGRDVLNSLSVTGIWDHLLLWHCSFPTVSGGIGSDSIGYGFTNSSFIGNVFQEFRATQHSIGTEIPFFLPGNVENNEALHNHYMGSYVDTSGCGGNPQPEGCPQWYSKSPDSDASGTQTLGDADMDLADNTEYINFGYPKSGSVLIDRLPTVLVPADLHGNARDSMPDVGALEYSFGSEVKYSRSDVDDSGTVNTGDALLTLRKSLGLDMSETAWQENSISGDVNCDAYTNSTDAMLVLRYSLGFDMSGTLWCE